jgi:hypothetical protein
MAQALGKIIGGILVGVCGLKQRNEKLRIKKFGGCESRLDVKELKIIYPFSMFHFLPFSPCKVKD